MGFSAGEVQNDVSRGDFGAESVLGSEMLLFRFLALSVFCEELAEGRILHVPEH